MPTDPKPLSTLFESEVPSKKDELIDALQSDLNREIDARKEERWIWLMSMMLLFDVFTFQGMSTWAGPFLVGLIQIIVLIALGRKWQVDHIWTLTEKIISKWDGKIK